MAHQGLTQSLAVLAAIALVTGAACTGSVSPPPPPPPPRPVSHALDAGHWGEFTSRRFELRIPLPDGHAWRIDDHATSWLSATHAATSSALLLRRWREDEIVNREKCERHARDLRTLPEREGSELLEERVIAVPPEFDTRVEIRVVPSSPKQPLHAFALAFGGSVHACFAFVYTTSADGPGAESIVGDRLATIVQESLGAIVVESPLDLGAHGKALEGPPKISP